MKGERAYLDWNASAPLCEAARTAMLDALELDGNPSSVHAQGRKLRQLVEAARRNVAALAGAKPEHVVFSSGATESASTLLTPDWRMGRAVLRMGRLYVCETDHPCIHNGGRFAPEQVTKIAVDGDGIVRLDLLRAALADHDRATGLPLVAMHLVHNETGVIQPAAEIAALVEAAGGILVLDAVQAAGRIPLSLDLADFLIVSSHKIGGPKGAGAIIARADLMMPTPLITGGGQERGHRGGTENVAAIAGFGAAAAEATKLLDRAGDMGALRDRIEAIVLDRAPGTVIHGSAAPRVANTSFFSLPGIKAETAQIAFDLAGVALSAGSACSSGRIGDNRTLAAMGVAGNAGALRVSVGPATRNEDIAAFEDALVQLLARTDRAKVA